MPQPVTTVKVSKKLQIAVPSMARRALDILPGDRLAVTVEGGAIYLRPVPRDPLAALRRRHGDVWRGGSAWLEQERQAWAEA